MGSLSGLIHQGAAQLGMSDETRRDYMQGVVGKRSCSDMSTREQWRVVEALKKDGFVPKAGKAKEKAVGSKRADFPQAKKIRAIWLMMARTDIVQNRSEQALEAYVQRICGRKLDEATVKQLQAVIESLKRWCARAVDKRVGEALTAILAGDMELATVLQGKVIAGVQGGLQ